MSYFGLLFLALSSTLLVLQFNLNTAQTYTYEFCNMGGNYTANSTYQTNLNLLLYSMSTYNTTTNNTRFYNTSVGRSPDRVDGLFQCRGDISSDDCKQCAETSSKEIITRCPFRKDSVVFYDECWLHYSDKSFISTMHDEPTLYLFNPANPLNPNYTDQFSPQLSKLMKELVVQAVSNSPNLFAVGNTNFSIYYSNIYALVQCTQDLSRRDCDKCLRKAVSELPTVYYKYLTGGRVINPSCIIRCELYPFFEQSGIGEQALAPLPPGSPLSNTTTTTGQEKSSSKKVIIIVISTIVGMVSLSCLIIWSSLRKRKGVQKSDDGEEIGTVESLQFGFRTIQDATNNFCDANKLGKGGFGIVYKGLLQDGREIAVKRLSRNSGQGAEEFKNEVLLIVKLQHRNLVKLLGFCLEGDEKLLIYEFAPNASLDSYIFDPIKCTYLDWESRYKIIGGIARGLLYLHEDSRHRIIHRDLKAGNILLDAQMEPKISDFGMARLFGVDQTEGSTARIVGTYGYMAPEYAMHGQYSVKSDVFSFGVLILEIITGQKNKLFFQSEHSKDLLSYVWTHWEAGTALELLEPTVKEHCSSSEVMRWIHIALLCVQEDAALRPTMATVVYMLNRDSVILPLPSTPAFFVNGREQVNTRDHGVDTKNELSMTELYAR